MMLMEELVRVLLNLGLCYGGKRVLNHRLPQIERIAQIVRQIREIRLICDDLRFRGYMEMNKMRGIKEGMIC